MDLKGLQVFQQLAQQLHFARTADKTHMSPSALSRTIQRLEQECGAPLLVRDKRNVKLTDAGIKLAEFANQVLIRWHQLQSDIADYQQVISGHLSLYCSVTASMSHLPDLLSQFRQHYPGIDVHLQTGDPALAVQKVRNQEVDVAITAYHKDFPSDLIFHEIDSVPMLLIAPTEYGSVKMDDLLSADQPFVLPESTNSRHIVYQWLAEKGIEPKVYAYIGGNEAIASLVALGCGVAIVPKLVTEHSIFRSKIQTFNLPDIEPLRLGLCALTKRTDEPAIKAMLQLNRLT